MPSRAPFDPRTHFAIATSADGGTNVWLDGVLTIEGSPPIWPDDDLVALAPCSDCESWGCNLVDGHASRVRRLGPYVLWVNTWRPALAFDAEAYDRALAPAVEARRARGFVEEVGDVRVLSPDDDDALPDPSPQGEHANPRFVSVAYDLQAEPDGPLARLARWPGDPSIVLVAVEPPRRAIELPSTRPDEPSWWIDADPRPDGGRAAYLPGLVRAPIWVAGPCVDRALAHLLDAR
jgi:hypothetical protein